MYLPNDCYCLFWHICVYIIYIWFVPSCFKTYYNVTVLHKDFQCDWLDTLGLTGLKAWPWDRCAQPYLPGGSVHFPCLYSVAACTNPQTSRLFPSVFCNSRYQGMAWKLVFDVPKYVLLCSNRKMDDCGVFFMLWQWIKQTCDSVTVIVCLSVSFVLM